MPPPRPRPPPSAARAGVSLAPASTASGASGARGWPRTSRRTRRREWRARGRGRPRTAPAPLAAAACSRATALRGEYANVFGAPREDEGCGRPKVRRSTVECSGVRVLSSAGWSTRIRVSRLDHRPNTAQRTMPVTAMSNAYGGEGSEKGQERPRPGVPTTARSASHSR